MADKGRMTQFRVLNDFTDHNGVEHKRGSIMEYAFNEAQGYVNAGKITADLAGMKEND